MKATPSRSAARPIPRDAGTDSPEEHVGYLLKRLQHSIRQAVDEAMREAGAGLSFAHIVALFGISHHPGVSGAHIAKRAMVTAQTINTILRRLEKEGSVERRPHPDNRRVDCWFITDAGRARMHQARAAADPVWARMLAPFETGELAQLRSLLKRCIAGLETGCPDAPPIQTATPARSSGSRRRSQATAKKNPKGK